MAQKRRRHPQGRSAPRLSLRVLATTDMHMNLLPHDYLSNHKGPKHGLARVASLIHRMRRERPNCLLLDNGDFLQGSALGDYIAECHDSAAQGLHPAIAAMNALHYDAAALGNHDFNFGLPFLLDAAQAARFPLLAANLVIHDSPGFASHVILRRQFRDQAGRPQTLRIAVMGLLPPQTAEWDRNLRDQMDCADIVQTARRILPAIRAGSADLVIALAHSGIGPLAHSPGMEHAATALAAVPGIDVVIAGHTHQVFPGPQIPKAPGIDPRRGRLAGKPAVMAGFGGSHLGVIDLELRQSAADGWKIAAATTCARPVDPALPSCPQITAPVLRAHQDTVRYFSRPVGRTDVPLHSFFSLLGHDPAIRIVNEAQRHHVSAKLRGSEWQGLAVLAATAPFRAGGRGGPDHYTDIPAGPLTLRSLIDLYAFPNRICALHVTGAQIRDWLERAAGQFCQLEPGRPDCPLIREDFPCYNFDMIDGLCWQIDLTAPRRFAPDGQLADPQARRIRDLRRADGRPVRPDDAFVLATSLYRLATCGLFAPLAGSARLILSDQTMTRDVLKDFLRSRESLQPNPAPHFTFRAPPGATALFDTSPAALTHLGALRLPGIQRIDQTGKTVDGFARLRLHL